MEDLSDSISLNSELLAAKAAMGSKLNDDSPRKSMENKLDLDLVFDS